MSISCSMVSGERAGGYAGGGAAVMAVNAAA